MWGSFPDSPRHKYLNNSIQGVVGGLSDQGLMLWEVGAHGKFLVLSSIQTGAMVSRVSNEGLTKGESAATPCRVNMKDVEIFEVVEVMTYSTRYKLHYLLEASIIDAGSLSM